MDFIGFYPENPANPDFQDSDVQRSSEARTLANELILWKLKK
jgi:hypothetical protein